MNRFLRAGILGFCLCGFGGLAQVATADPQHPPAEAFGALPEISNPVLSPDGIHLAIIQSLHGRPAIVIYELPTQPGKPPAVVAADKWVLDAIRWVKNDRLVLTIKDNRTSIDGTLRTWERTMAVGTDGKDAQTLMGNIGQIVFNTRSKLIDDIAPDDPDHIYMSLFTDNESTVQKVDVRDGIAKEVFRGTGPTEQWLMNGHGQLVAHIDHKLTAPSYDLYIHHNNDYEKAGPFPALDALGSGVVGLSNDGNALVLMDDKNHDTAILLRHDLTSGIEAPVFAAPGHDVTDAILDEWTGRVIGAVYADDRLEYRYFDPQREALQQELEKNFPDASIEIVSSDVAGDEMIIRIDRPSRFPDYLLLNNGDGKSVGATYPLLAAVRLGAMKPYNYEARDGLDIPAYLTLPPDRLPKNLPLVVMPHDGPDDRDTLGFNWLAQFLANRGYAVLQPNYRGSSGYDHKFTEAGFKQWGLKMQDDITDGVKKAIADGIADPKRVCIVGTGYGGYAALAGGAFTPDLYACVVGIAGISDLPAMLHTEHMYYGERFTSFLSSRIGSLDEDLDQLKNTSPALHAENFRAPVLLMHGEEDTTVRIDQSEIMDDALKKAGKPVKFIRLPGSDHYLSLAETRIRVLKEIEGFLDSCIGH